MGIFARLKASFQGKEDADRYLKGLDKSKKSFGERLRRLASGFRGVDEDFLEEVMVILLEADVGIHTAEKITSRLESEAARQKLKTFDEISECLVSVMLDMYNEHEDAPVRTNEDGPTVILMVGVNGSGKTTTAAKLTRAFQEEGKSVVLAAADTFRAGAVDQ
ncbi:MAG: signal recognition particle receptor subunit alpha, partial [Merdibacter sp.]|nr:signal recognition particle receptor subunit alpha [Merdibacter sp.]